MQLLQRLCKPGAIAIPAPRFLLGVYLFLMMYPALLKLQVSKLKRLKDNPNTSGCVLLYPM